MEAKSQQDGQRTQTTWDQIWLVQLVHTWHFGSVQAFVRCVIIADGSEYFKVSERYWYGNVNQLNLISCCLCMLTILLWPCILIYMQRSIIYNKRAEYHLCVGGAVLHTKHFQPSIWVWCHTDHSISNTVLETWRHNKGFEGIQKRIDNCEVSSDIGNILCEISSFFMFTADQF